jgi:hypothetical protein
MLMFGVEYCDICGETVNMGEIHVVNPRLGQDVPLPILALHYMEHGSFSYSGNLHKGRVHIAALLHALELRLPYETDDHQLPLDYVTDTGEPVASDTNDLDGDLLADSEELATSQPVFDPDQNDNLLPDGVEIARRCAEIIERLPTLAPDAAAKGVYKVDFMQRGLEWCEICGESINMGYWQIVNASSGASIDVPVIAWHFMQHGSFSYLGDVHGAGRADVAKLWEILELPDRCGDPGTLYLPGDVNKDCKVNIIDYAAMAEHWLDSTDPAAE